MVAHPHPNPPLEREGILSLLYLQGSFQPPPPSRGRSGGGWGEKTQSHVEM
jgi:hypothetical protein